MQLHNLKPKNKKKKKKRRGRGGSRGNFSGRGVKGQKKRSGRDLPSYEEELIKKFPKLKGIKNKSHKPDNTVLNVGVLDQIFVDEKKITRSTLAEKGIIKKQSEPVKILGDGEVKNSFTVEGVPVSVSAKEKIEAAGGKIS